MTNSADTLIVVNEWWSGLRTYAQNNNLPAKGTVAGALVVLERLKNTYQLDVKEHVTKAGSQIAGAGKGSTQRILARFGENRAFLEEAGRTNRGLINEVSQLLVALERAELEHISIDERNDVLTTVQQWLVDKVGEYFNRQRVTFTYQSHNTSWQAIHELLQQAKSVGKEGPVAQYLIGAKLALRFPDLDIRNDSYSTSDTQSGLPGDFQVKKMVFHVTVSPMPSHFDKCKTNLLQGYHPNLVVPYRLFVGTRQNADNVAPGQINVRSFEDFVSQNLDELCAVSEGEVVSGFRRLLDVYNQRVDRIETDKSMLIEIPKNLQD